MVKNLATFSTYGGETWKVLRFPDSSATEWSCFNPSIGYQKDIGFVCLFRSSNYWYADDGKRLELLAENAVRNRTYFSILDSKMNVTELLEITYHGFNEKLVRGPEDPKIYWRNNRWEFTTVIKEEWCNTPRIATFWLDGSDAHLIKLWESPDPKRTEKNWMTSYGENNAFDFIYGPDIIYKNSKLIDLKDKNPDLSGLRGSSNLWELEDGTYLALTHKCYVDTVYVYNPHTFGIMKTCPRDYTHLFIRLSKSGQILQKTPEFHFRTSGIEFGSGLVVVDNVVYVSFGVKDLVSYFGKIKLDKVMELLNDC